MICKLIESLPLYLNLNLMSYYTPVKKNESLATNTNRTAIQQREGDWICLSCHNLNFSFRKKCNRCKVQTKIQNQSSTAFLLDYYQKNYFCKQDPIQNNCISVNTKIINDHSANHSHTPPKHAKYQWIQKKQNRTPSTHKTHKTDLPSVSPLIKKYKARQRTPISEYISNESIWSVKVINFQSFLSSSQNDERQSLKSSSGDQSEQEWRDEQLQVLIGRVMQ